MTQLFNFRKETALLLGDYDMNSMQLYTNSLTEFLRKRMLEQEITFQKQVHELHRLYSIQKVLMEDIGFRELELGCSWKANTQSLEQEAKFSSSPVTMMGSARPITQDMSEGFGGFYSMFQQRPFNLQLPAYQGINYVDNGHPNKGNFSDCLKETPELKSTGNFPVPLDLRLSLSPVADDQKKKNMKSSMFDKKTNIHSQVVIDLEESTERISNEDTQSLPPRCYDAQFTGFGRKNASLVDITDDPFRSRSMKINPSHETSESTSLMVESKCYIENSSTQECNKCHDNLPISSLSSGKKCISYEVRHFDLNKVQLDDLSCYSNDVHMLSCPSVVSSSVDNGLVEEAIACPKTWRKDDKSSGEEFDMPRHDDAVKLPSTDSIREDDKKEFRVINSGNSRVSGSEMSITGVTHVFELDLNEDLHNHGSGPDIKNDYLIREHQNGCVHDQNQTCKVTKQMILGKVEAEDMVMFCSDESQITVEDKCDSGLLVGNFVHDASNAKTIQYGMSFVPASDQVSGTHVGSHVVETLSGEQDQRSCGSSKFKHDFCSEKEDSSEMDILTKCAAESLIEMSLNFSAHHDYCSAQAGSEKMEKEEQKPQYSADSFELMTLKLKESSAEDDSASSKPFEVVGSDGKDYSFKLRRGRRLKDFRKDILPGLASLSRHEIREDINILEGVLRSREYRKMRAKMACGGDSWHVPVRSRRSRANYNGKRSSR